MSSLFVAGAVFCACWRCARNREVAAFGGLALRSCLAGLLDAFALVRLPASLLKKEALMQRMSRMKRSFSRLKTSEFWGKSRTKRSFWTLDACFLWRKQECAARVPYNAYKILQECLLQESHTSVLQECRAKVFHKSVLRALHTPQWCLLQDGLPQECPTRRFTSLPHKSIKQCSAVCFRARVCVQGFLVFFPQHLTMIQMAPALERGAAFSVS